MSQKPKPEDPPFADDLLDFRRLAAPPYTSGPESQPPSPHPEFLSMYCEKEHKEFRSTLTLFPPNPAQRLL